MTHLPSHRPPFALGEIRPNQKVQGAHRTIGPQHGGAGGGKGILHRISAACLLGMGPGTPEPRAVTIAPKRPARRAVVKHAPLLKVGRIFRGMGFLARPHQGSKAARRGGVNA
jgi:hypothetical protein